MTGNHLAIICNHCHTGMRIAEWINRSERVQDRISGWESLQPELDGFFLRHGPCETNDLDEVEQFRFELETTDGWEYERLNTIALEDNTDILDQPYGLDEIAG